MSDKAQVSYYALAGDKSSEKVVEEIHGAGFMPILLSIDPNVDAGGARIGGGSSEFHVVDLKDWTMETARFMLEKSPELRGRILVLEQSPTVALEPDGLISATPASLVNTLRGLNEAR